MTSNRKLERLLFDYGTTNNTDYRPFKIKHYPETVLKPKAPKPDPIYVPLKDTHTLTPVNGYIPFNLYIKGDPITRKNPRIPTKPYCPPPESSDRKEVQKTRPRLLISPQISMDDIEGPARDIIIKDTYTTDMMRGSLEAAQDYFSVKAPMPLLPAPARPIQLPKPELPYVAPEWRMGTFTWESKQIRNYCDATKEFWTRYPPLQSCRACEESAIIKEHRRRRL